MSIESNSLKGYPFDCVPLAADNLLSFTNNRMIGCSFKTNPNLEKVRKVFLSHLSELNSEVGLGCEVSLIELVETEGKRELSEDPVDLAAAEMRPYGNVEISVRVKTEAAEKTLLIIEEVIKKVLTKLKAEEEGLLKSEMTVETPQHSFLTCSLRPLKKYPPVQIVAHAVRDWDTPIDLLNHTSIKIPLGSFGDVPLRTGSSIPGIYQEFSLEKLMWVFLSRLKRETNLDCEVFIVGSYAKDIALHKDLKERESSFSVEDRPYGDIDISICVDTDNATQAIFDVERVLKDILNIKPIEHNLFSEDHTLGLCELDTVADSDIPIEISIHATKGKIPTHISNYTSFKIPLRSFETKLGSIAENEYQIYSMDGEFDSIVTDVKKGRIYSRTASGGHGLGWFRILTDITKGAAYLPAENHRDFYLKDALAGKKIVEKMSKTIKHMREKKRDREIVFFMTNALMHSSLEEKLMGKERNSELSSFFIKPLRDYLEKSKASGWVSSLNQVLKDSSDDQVVSVLKSIIPLFAENIYLKTHLGQTVLQCEFTSEGHLFYIIVPFREESDHLTFKDPAVDLKIAKAQMKFLLDFFSMPEADRSVQELKTALTDLDLSSFSSEEKSALASKILELHRWVLESYPDDFEMVSSLFALVDQLMPSLPSMKEKTTLAYGVMSSFFKAYEHKLDAIPSFLWIQLEKIASVSVGKGPALKLWKTLFISLLYQLPESYSPEMQNFLSRLSEQTELSPLSDHLEMFPKGESVMAYFKGLNRLANNPENLIKIAFTAYRYFSSNLAIADFLEKNYLFKEEASEALKELVESKGPLRAEYGKIIKARVNHYSQKEKPIPALHLMSCLAETQDITMELFELLQKCKQSSEKMDLLVLGIEKRFSFVWDFLLEKDPDLIFTLSEKYSAIFSRVRESRLSQMTDQLEGLILESAEKVQKIATELLKGSSLKEKGLLTKKCVDLSSSQDQKTVKRLFALSLEPSSNLQELFALSRWTNESLFKLATLLVDIDQMSSDRALMIFSQIKDPIASQELLYQILPFLDPVSKNLFISQVKSQIEQAVLAKDSAQVVVFWSFVTSPRLGAFFKKEELSQLESLCFASTLEKMQESVAKANVFNLMKAHIVTSASGLEKAKLAYLCCSSLKNEYKKARELFLACTYSFEELKAYLSEVIGDDLLLNDHLLSGLRFLEPSEKQLIPYVEFALEKAKGYPIAMFQAMRPFFNEKTQAMFLSKTILESTAIREGKLLDRIEPYLSFILQSDFVPYLVKGSPLYSAFIQVADLYLSSKGDFKKRAQLAPKIWKLIKEEAKEGSRLSLEDRFFQMKVAFVSADQFPSLFKEEDKKWLAQEVIQMGDFYLKRFSLEMQASSVKAKILFIQILDRILSPETNPEGVLKILSQQIRALSKESLGKEDLKNLNVSSLINNIIRFRELPSAEVSSCSKYLVQILSKTSQDMASRKLMMEVHLFRIKKEMEEHSNGGSASLNVEVDYLAYLDYIFVVATEKTQEASHLDGELLYTQFTAFQRQIQDPVFFRKFTEIALQKILNICQIENFDTVTLATVGLRFIYGLNSPKEFLETIKCFLRFFVKLKDKSLVRLPFLEVFVKLVENKSYEPCITEFLNEIWEEIYLPCLGMQKTVETEAQFELIQEASKLLVLLMLNFKADYRSGIFSIVARLSAYKKEPVLDVFFYAIDLFESSKRNTSDHWEARQKLSILFGDLRPLVEGTSKDKMFKEKMNLALMDTPIDDHFLDSASRLEEFNDALKNMMDLISTDEGQNFLGYLDDIEAFLYILLENVSNPDAIQEIEKVLVLLANRLIEMEEPQSVFHCNEILAYVLFACETESAKNLAEELIQKIRIPFLDFVSTTLIPRLENALAPNSDQNLESDLSLYCEYLKWIFFDLEGSDPELISNEKMALLIALYKKNNPSDGEFCLRKLFEKITLVYEEDSPKKHRTCLTALLAVSELLSQKKDISDFEHQKCLKHASELILFASECPLDEKPGQCIEFFKTYYLFKSKMESLGLSFQVLSPAFELKLLVENAAVFFNKENLENYDFDSIFYLMECINSKMEHLNDEPGRSALNTCLINLLKKVVQGRSDVLDEWIQKNGFPSIMSQMIETVSMAQPDLGRDLQARWKALR